MRVLLLNYEYPPLGGGAGNATAYMLARFFDDPELDVDLITSAAEPGAGRVETLAPNVRAHFLDIGKRGGLHYQSHRDLLAYAWRAHGYAKRLIRAAPCDLCHAFFGIPCGFIARRLGLPYIVSLRGSDVPFYSERFKHLDRLVFKRLSIGIWADAHAVVANSEGLRQLALESAPEQSIDVIYNGVDTAEFRPAAPPPPRPLRVLCVSRLIPRKGIDDLIRAFDGLDGAELTIAGKGNQEAELRRLTAERKLDDRIRFEGFVSHGAIAALYQRHHVFALPSLNEGMSNTVLEAMACGLPIAMTNTGGASELIEDGRNGFLLAKRDPEAIRRVLRRYRDDPALAGAHGAQARRKAEALSWDQAAQAYKDHYRAASSAS